MVRKKTFNKWNRIVHRDLGFFFFGVIIIYAVSGIALNHLEDWNPNYIVTQYSKHIANAADYKHADKTKVKAMLQQIGETAVYKKHIYNGSQSMKVFIQNGSAVLDFETATLDVDISGIIITKGKKGIKGRGGIYILLGIIVPVLFLFFL